MAFNIVGSLSATSQTKKVLRRQSYQKDPNGLETLTETYLVRSSNLISLVPVKDVLHSEFSTATTKFTRMAVESTSTSEQDGGVSELNVTYVGLTSSTGLPPALVRTIPVTGAGIYGPPLIVEVEFVSDSTVQNIIIGQITANSLLKKRLSGAGNLFQLPQTINGTTMPQSPRAPFNQGAKFTDREGTVLTEVFYEYWGYVQKDVQVTQRGKFVVAVYTFQEYAVGLKGASF